MFSDLKNRLNDAVENIGKKVTEREITDEDLDTVLEDLKITLIKSDVALETADRICGEVKDDLEGLEVKRTKIEGTIKQSFRNAIMDILSEKENIVEKIKDSDKPVVVLFLGFNGSGKTTTLAKFARILHEKGLTTVFAAADTYRAASIEQLEKHGNALNSKVIKHDYKADAAAVVYDAIEHASSEGKDVVLADTAGRSHADTNLMDELEKICDVNEPDWKILVLDSLTGNDAVEQARRFEDSVGVDGIVLTKMDVNEKGGAAISVSHTIDSPILYMGVGQEYGDLEEFDPDRIIDRILD
ncbi:MAG: signal recognition particle-docking protein FtsY [Candidatus Aenigmatarchaeota archaeon]